MTTVGSHFTASPSIHDRYTISKSNEIIAILTIGLPLIYNLFMYISKQHYYTYNTKKITHIYLISVTIEALLCAFLYRSSAYKTMYLGMTLSHVIMGFDTYLTERKIYA